MKPECPYRTVLLSAFLCSAPAMLLFRFVSPGVGARAFAATLLAAMGVQLLMRSPYGLLALVLATSPAMQFFKNIDYFFLPIATTFISVSYWLLWYPARWHKLLSNSLWGALTVSALIYWWLSLLNVGVYSANLRALELVFSASGIVILATRRGALRAAFTGFALSTFCYGMGTAGLADRLGMAVIDGHNYGNAILMGTSAALVVLLCVADDGHWLWLGCGRWLRFWLTAGGAVCLVLSGSRGGWLVTLLGLLLVFSFARAQRRALLLFIVFFGAIVAVLVATGSTESMEGYAEKTIGADVSMAKRTTGRSEQWELIPRVLADFPFGFGPGTGSQSSVYYGHKELVWHSLYLHIAAETGIPGLAVLAALLSTALLRATRHLHLCRESMPLLGVTGFMTIGLSVSALDAVSGVYLGLSMAALEFSGFYRVIPVTCVSSSSAA